MVILLLLLLKCINMYIDSAAADVSWSTVLKCEGAGGGVQPDATYVDDRVCTKVAYSQL